MHIYMNMVECLVGLVSCIYQDFAMRNVFRGKTTWKKRLEKQSVFELLWTYCGAYTKKITDYDDNNIYDYKNSL